MMFGRHITAWLAIGIAIAYGRPGRHWLWRLIVGMVKGAVLAALVLIVLNVFAALSG